MKKTFKIPYELTNRNTGRGSHWGNTAREKEEWVRRLGKLPSPFFGVSFPCALVVTRILGPGQKFWDADSILRGNWKELQDAMVGAGWLEDDDSRYLSDVIPKQDKTRRSEGPSIEVCIIDPKTLRIFLENATQGAE